MLKIKVSIDGGSLLVLLLCLCKSFKELFLFWLVRSVVLKSGCKGTHYFPNYQMF